ncbi:OsmC family protein [Magnetospirillum molischianum]|uniref:OsmC family protein n=1 Tax=Magnetospirillum molischianum DSM 120 TaxID=1150626 RepID=H8FNN0_MAGML|nr:OsmC family protein [Magnetospirillum molischianum]CCG39968.1 conserved hypothetical protein [Magnetospirillum molischianum DSM 120]
MNAEDLRTLQAPLKEAYKTTPGSALVTLSSRGDLDADDVVCRVETGRTLVAAGLHPATGGTGAFACSGNMLLDALAACAGVTLKAVATAIGFELKSGSITVEGDLDFRGTLGVAKDAPVGFAAIRIGFSLDTTEPPERIDQLIRLTERYCVVFQTLAHPPILSLKSDHHE